MIVTYNLIIGILMMLASGKIASYAGHLGQRFGRYTKVAVFTFGSCVTAISGPFVVAVLVLRPGME